MKEFKVVLLLTILLISSACANTAPAVSPTLVASPMVVTTSTSVHAPTITSTPVPTLLPFTGKIAFIVWNKGTFENDRIYVMKANGSEQTDITPPNLLGVENLAWSPDGQYFAFDAVAGQVLQIFKIKSDGSGLKQLTFEKSSSYRPAWSPDGNYIIFLSARDDVVDNLGNPVQQGYIMKFDGTEQQRFTNNRDFVDGLSWYGNNDLISVSVAETRYTLRTYIVDVNGVKQKQIPEFVIDSIPYWSPNGEFVVFANSCGINFMKADSSDEDCLIKNTASPLVYNDSPSWSPDGRYIIFLSNRNGNDNLYVVKTDGSDLTLLTNMSGNVTSPVWSAEP